jgi:hypothetical protein
LSGPPGDGATVTVSVRVPQADAFDIFTLPEGHPARHGLEAAAFSRMIGLWWGELMTGLREHVALRTS